MTQSIPVSSASGSISQNIVQFEMEKSALKCNLNKMMITKVKWGVDEKPMIDQKYVLSFQSKFQMDDTQFDVRQILFLYQKETNKFKKNRTFICKNSFAKFRFGRFRCQLWSSFGGTKSLKPGPISLGVMLSQKMIAIHFQPSIASHGRN